jgi:hypothetical protein
MPVRFIRFKNNNVQMSWGKAADILVEAFLSITLISTILFAIHIENGLNPILVSFIEIVMIMGGIVITVRAFMDGFDYGIIFGINLAILSFSSLFAPVGLLFQVLIAVAFLVTATILFPDSCKGILRSIHEPFQDEA